MRRLLLTTSAALLLAAPAAASTSWTVRGGGFGHGLGMSQYGAYGYAKQGRGYEAILMHYYQGTRLGATSDQTVRVLLQSGRSETSFAGATRVPGKSLNPRRTYRVRRYGIDRLELRTTRGTLVGRFASPLRASSASGYVQLGGSAINGISGGRYRDVLEFRASTFGGITSVNAASLDNYVRGVVPGEMPAEWHTEALKAQAVAARSYALATDRGGAVFDQYPDTRSQVYKGMSGEAARSNAAVVATSDQVLRYAGKIAVTYFFSTSGGQTENVENVFYGSKPQPYLKGVDDPFDDISPRHRWRFRFSQSRMQSRLSGVTKGTLRSIKVVKRGVSPRIVWADVVGSRGKTRVRGTTLRQALGLYDNWAYFTKVSSSQATQARASGNWLAGLLAPRVWRLEGTVTPAPRARAIAVERRLHGRWHRVRRARTSAGGAYRVALPARGIYRVRAGRSVVGPAVRVR